MQSAETELQNTIELRATASEIEAPKPDLGAKAKKYDFEAFFKRNLEKTADTSLSAHGAYNFYR